MIQLELNLTEQEIEEDRAVTLNDCTKRRDSTEDELRERYCNPYGYREVLHLSYVQHEVIEEYLVAHPAIVLDPTAYRWAYLASQCLFELYQRIGNLESECNDGT